MVVVGAGAAGLVAAWHAAAGARPVILLERTPNGARKILISGGGRCNILPRELEPARFVTSSSPNSLRKMLTSWPLEEQLTFFASTIGISLKFEEVSGKYFPRSDSAKEVRDRLFDAVSDRGVQVRFGAKVEDAAPKSGAWRVTLDDELIEASAVILATGGLSVPGTGSDGAGLRLAARLGHAIHPTAPALTPLLCDDRDFRALAGISLEVELGAGSGSGALLTRGGFLFTHKGYSGPAVLDLSHRLVADPATPLVANWLCQPADEIDRELRSGAATTVRAWTRRRLPERLADLLVDRAKVEAGCRLAELAKAQRQALVTQLARCPLPVTGHEGYAKAEVTSGGVDLAEVDPRTLESRRAKGLYLCGEILDAFGPIGGHNFAWAWATGRAAGRASAQA